MIGSLLRIVVGFKVKVTAGCNERELANLMTLWPLDWIVAQIAVSDIDRQRRSIHQLDEVIREKRHRVREPLVDFDSGRRGLRGDDVRGAKGRAAHIPRAIAFAPPDGNIRELRTEG